MGAVPGVAQTSGLGSLLQGNSTSLQGSDYNPQSTAPATTLQPAGSTSAAPKTTTKSLGSMPSSTGGGGSTSAVNTSTPAYNPDANAQTQSDQAAAAAAAQKATQEQGIHDEFSTYRSGLDNMAGLLPSQKADLQKTIDDLTASENTGIDQATAQAHGDLTNSENAEKAATTAGLRDLEDNANGLMTGFAARMSGSGAGDSSAAQYGSEVLGRQILKGRTAYNTQRDSVMQTLSQKHADVDATAQQQHNQIEQARLGKVADLTQYFQGQQNNLEQMKVNATKDEQDAINKMQMGLDQQLQARVQQVNDTANNYKSTLSAWQTEQQQALQGQLKAIAASASYSGSNAQPQLVTQPTFNSVGQQTGVGYMTYKNGVLTPVSPNATSNNDTSNAGLLTMAQPQGIPLNIGTATGGGSGTLTMGSAQGLGSLITP